MKPENTPNASSQQKVYYRSNRNTIIVIAVFLIIIALTFEVPLIAQFITFCAAALLVYSAVQIKLVTSPEGIAYYQVGYSVSTTWDNLARIEDIPAGRITVEGLILHEPALYVDKWLSGAKYIQSRGQLIPLSFFGRDWLNSELGDDLKRYAPHLFARNE